MWRKLLLDRGVYAWFITWLFHNMATCLLAAESAEVQLRLLGRLALSPSWLECSGYFVLVSSHSPWIFSEGMRGSLANIIT